MDGVLGNKIKRRKLKRRKQGKGKMKEISLNIFSANAAGLKSRMKSFKHEIKALDISIFSLQETHFQKKGLIKVEGFEIFESIRKKKDGGTVVGVHKSLKPMLISEYSEPFEIIIVEIIVNGKEIRIISGYGPQETWPEDQRMPFFIALEEEINRAEMLGI